VKSIVVITPGDARCGFALAGVRQLVLEREGLEQALTGLQRDPAVGVLVIDERLVDEAASRRLTEMERSWPGVVAVLPAPEKAAAVEEDYALRLVREAVGYQVRMSL
jgi:V/A-type H+-transporting ATPase subunit F